jgi:hypothetical protein
MFVKYIGPNQTLRNEINAILNIGLDVDPQTGVPDPQQGLAKRARKIRDVIEKWKDRVHPNFIKEMANVAEWASQPKETVEKPSMPNPEAYNLRNEDQLAEFLGECQDAFIRLDRYHTEDKKVKSLPEREPSNRFMEMSNGIRRLFESLEETGKIIERPKHVYHFTEMGDGLCIEVLDKADVEYFRSLADQTKGCLEDDVKYVIVPAPGEKKAEPEKPVEKTKTAPATQPTSSNSDDNLADSYQSESLASLLSECSKQELIDTYPDIGLEMKMSKVQMIEKIMESEK